MSAVPKLILIAMATTAVVAAMSLGGGAARAADWQRGVSCIGGNDPAFTNSCNFPVTVYYAPENSQSAAEVKSIDIPAKQTRTPAVSAEALKHLLFVECRLHETAFIGRDGTEVWYPGQAFQCRAAG